MSSTEDRRKAAQTYPFSTTFIGPGKEPDMAFWLDAHDAAHECEHGALPFDSKYPDDCDCWKETTPMDDFTITVKVSDWAFTQPLREFQRLMKAELADVFDEFVIEHRRRSTLTTAPHTNREQENGTNGN